MTLKFYNKNHLGDCAFSVNIFNKLVKVNDLKIEFFIFPQYISEIYQQVEDKKLISLLPVNLCNDTIHENCHIGRDNSIFLTRMSEGQEYTYFEVFEFLCNKYNLVNPLKSPNDVIFDNIGLDIKNELCYEHDFLIINARPLSNQFQYKENEFELLSQKLINNGYKIITINPTRTSAPYTIGKYSLLQLGSIATYSKNIIGINTAPMMTAINKKNINKLEHIILMDDNTKFNYNDRIYQIKSNDNIIEKVEEILKIKL